MMIEIVSFSRKSWKIAQTSREEQPPDPLNSKPPTLANSTNNYLGLVFLSIFLFLFLIFLLLKRKTKEIRLSIFSTLLLASLLTVYTSVQITTKFLIGDEKDRKLEQIGSNNETNVSQTKKNKAGERKSKEKTDDKKQKELQEGQTETKPTNSDESEENKVEVKKLNSDNNNERVSNLESSNLEDRNNISQQNNTTNSENNVSNTSPSSISQRINLEQENRPISNANQRNLENNSTSNSTNNSTSNSTSNSTNNSTSNSTRSSNLSSTSQRTSINRERRSRDRSSNSATVQTSSFSPIFLKLGDRGLDVTILQRLLQELGYYTFNIDGDYGLSTELAVRNFQQQNNLLVDGVVGFSTCNILNAKTTNTKLKCSY